MLLKLSPWLPRSPHRAVRNNTAPSSSLFRPYLPHSSRCSLHHTSHRIFCSHPCLCCPLGSHSVSNPSLSILTLFLLLFLLCAPPKPEGRLRPQHCISHMGLASELCTQAPPAHQQSCTRSNSFPGKHPIPLFFLSAPNPHHSPPHHPLSEGSAKK